MFQPGVNLVEYHDRWAKKVLDDPKCTCWNYHMAPPSGPDCGTPKALSKNIYIDNNKGIVGRLGVQFGDQEVAEKEMEDLISIAPKVMFGWKHQPFNLVNQSSSKRNKNRVINIVLT